jgi:predicted protein tyrosine phosphatase
MVRALFVCSQNRLRSPTAEDTFAKWQGVETASAGTDEKASTRLDAEAIEWAEIIFVMERAHRNRVTKRFGHQVRNKRLVVLDIPDEYEFMDPALIKVLERKVGPYLVRLGGAPPVIAESGS